MYKDNLNKPMVYIFAFEVLGIIIGYFLFIEKSLFIIVPILIIVTLHFAIKSKYYFALIPFLILGVMSFYSYFHIEEGEFYNLEIRVEKIYYDGRAVGNMGNKKVELIYDDYTLKKGMIYNLRGEIKKESVVENGVVAVINGEIINEKRDFYYYIFDFKENFYNRLSKIIGEEEGAVINSIAFGDESFLSTDSKELFKDFGISHIISVSGTHVSLIFLVFNKFFGITSSLLLTFLYCIFVGNKTSAIRAFIMILLSKVALKLKKNYDGVSAIAFAGFIILLIKPYDIFTLGFSLSFLATLGIILFNKKINIKLYKLPNKIRESIALSLAAQILSFPYILMTIKEFTPLMFIGNFLLVPIYSMLIILGNLMIPLYFMGKIFNLSAYFVKVIFIFLNGIYHFFERIPQMNIYGNEALAFCIIILYIAMILYKRGYKKIIYMPVFSVVFLVFTMYTVIPYIDIFSYKGETAYILREKNKSIFFSLKRIKTLDEEIYLKNYLNLDIVKDITESTYVKTDNLEITIEGSAVILKNPYKEYFLVDYENTEVSAFKDYGYSHKKNYDIIVYNKDNRYYSSPQKIDRVYLYKGYSF